MGVVIDIDRLDGEIDDEDIEAAPSARLEILGWAKFLEDFLVEEVTIHAAPTNDGGAILIVDRPGKRISISFGPKGSSVVAVDLASGSTRRIGK